MSGADDRPPAGFCLVRAANHNKRSLPEGCDVPDHPGPRRAGGSPLSRDTPRRPRGPTAPVDPYLDPGDVTLPGELPKPGDELWLEEPHVRGERRFVARNDERLAVDAHRPGARRHGDAHHLVPPVEHDLDASPCRRAEPLEHPVQRLAHPPRGRGTTGKWLPAHAHSQPPAGSGDGHWTRRAHDRAWTRRAPRRPQSTRAIVQLALSRRQSAGPMVPPASRSTTSGSAPGGRPLAVVSSVCPAGRWASRAAPRSGSSSLKTSSSRRTGGLPLVSVTTS